MGKPGSIGCIRMRNRDIAELFDQVAAGTPVEIAA
jgi:lipoprotein-anchoring transpeptidase ErfK/SrfK